MQVISIHLRAYSILEDRAVKNQRPIADTRRTPVPSPWRTATPGGFVLTRPGPDRVAAAVVLARFQLEYIENESVVPFQAFSAPYRISQKQHANQICLPETAYTKILHSAMAAYQGHGGLQNEGIMGMTRGQKPQSMKDRTALND